MPHYELVQSGAEIAIAGAVNRIRRDSLRLGMQRHDLQATFLGHGEQAATGTCEFGDT